MPTFDTPSPIDLAINLQVGAIDVVASDRTDTVVTVSPTNPAKAVDRRGAQETTVDFDGRRLTDHRTEAAPLLDRPDRVGRPPGRAARGVAAHRRGCGRWSPQRRTTRRHPHQVLDGSGRPRRHRRPLGPRRARQRRSGDRGRRRRDHRRPRPDPARHGHGRRSPQGVARQHPGRPSPAGTSRPSSRTAASRSRAPTGSVAAKTAYGAIELREVSSGSIQVESGFGQVTIGVRAGVPAWLDLSSKSGHVRNQLDGDRAPDESEQTVAIRARTQAGDITIERAR